MLLEVEDDWAVVCRYMTFEVPVKELDHNDTKRIIEAMKKAAEQSPDGASRYPT